MSTLLKVLLVEDNKAIAQAIAHTLKSSYDIDVALNGKQAINKTDAFSYDLVILDLILPDISGLIICQQLRNRGISAPILILSADSKVMTKISLLDAGANDYLTKPFSLGELKARIRSLTRLSPTFHWPASILTIGSVTIDRRGAIVMRHGQEIQLRKKEFALLNCLMENAGKVVRRDELICNVWNNDNLTWKSSLDVHIKYLRDKIDKPYNSSLIKTVHGLGYKFDSTNNSSDISTLVT